MADDPACGKAFDNVIKELKPGVRFPQHCIERASTACLVNLTRESRSGFDMSASICQDASTHRCVGALARHIRVFWRSQPPRQPCGPSSGFDGA
jgi:hypothetical protein